MNAPRIAIAGILLESNAFAPPTTRKDFEDFMLVSGEALGGFFQNMVASRSGEGAANDVELVPILIAAAESGGPMRHEDYLELRDDITARMKASGDLDGVFIFGHGAGKTTELDDLDGDYFSAIRDVVGPDVPIVAELDFHANLSDAMVEAVDVLVGYRTNPHIDQYDRAVESLSILRRLTSGEEVSVAYERLPLITAQIAQLTASGEPLGELMAAAEQEMECDNVANITLLPGFSFGDTEYNGFSVIVTTWNDPAAAERICRKFSAMTWDMRNRFVRSGISIEDAVATEAACAAESKTSPRIYADVADNPGGGGRANTLHLLRAFADAGIENVIAGVFYDPALVREAHNHAVGEAFLAEFNAEEQSELSGRWRTQAVVRRLFDGAFKAELGCQRGERVNLGKCAVLTLCDGRIGVIVSSLRNQVLSPEYFSVGGLDVGAANAVILKSRGHFREGFSTVAPPQQIFEVDGPGLTTASIAEVDWRALPRPFYPVDTGVVWTPNISVKGVLASAT